MRSFSGKYLHSLEISTHWSISPVEAILYQLENAKSNFEILFYLSNNKIWNETSSTSKPLPFGFFLSVWLFCVVLLLRRLDTPNRVKEVCYLILGIFKNHICIWIFFCICCMNTLICHEKSKSIFNCLSDVVPGDQNDTSYGPYVDKNHPNRRLEPRAMVISHTYSNGLSSSMATSVG